MNMRTRAVGSVVVAALMVGSAYGGTIKSRGTAGAYELSIPVGARGIALSGANLAIVSGVEALFYNPAGASALDRGVEAQFTNMAYIADIAVNYGALVANIGRAGAVGFSIKSLDFGDISRTSAENTEGTGETFSPSFITAAVTWSKAFSDRIRFGTNFKFVSETILRTGATGVAVDLGVQYNFANLPVRVGVVLKNLGSKMQFRGPDLEQRHRPEGAAAGTLNESFQAVSEGFEMPAELNIAVSWNLIPGLSLVSSFQNNAFTNNEMRFGGEYSLSFGTASVWLGGAISMATIDDEQGEISDADWDEYTSSNFGATMGAGVGVPLGDMIVSFEVAQRAVTSYFDDNTVWSLKLAF